MDTNTFCKDVTEIIGSGKVDLGFKAMIHTLAVSCSEHEYSTVWICSCGLLTTI